MPTPNTGMVKAPSGRDLTVIVSNLAGRKPFPNGLVTSAEWDKSATGGDGRFTLTCQVVRGLSALPQLAHDDLVQIWARGLLRYQGLVSEIARSREKADSLTLSGYGFWQRIGGIPTDRQYVYPIDQDIAQVMRDVATDSILPIYPLLEVDAQTLGRTISSLDGTGKTVGDVLSDLLKVAGDRGAYGVDRNPETFGTRLFLRPFNLTTPVHVLGADHPQLTALSSEEQSADVVTRLRIQGGTPRFPNLVPNASFEKLRLSSEKDNLVQNGGLDEPSPIKGYWQLYGGASYKTGSNTEGRTYAGDRMIETDNAGEGFWQRRQNYSKIVPGHSYALTVYVKREAGNNNATGTIRLFWLDSSNNTIRTDTLGTDVVYADSVLWRQVGGLFTAPTGAAGFEIRCECSNPSLLWDEVAFYDASLVRQLGWRQEGAGTVVALDWAHPGAKHGGYCVRLKVQASDSDGGDISLLSDRFAVETRQALRISCWVKSPAGVTTLPKLQLKMKLYDSNGTLSEQNTQNINPLQVVPAGAALTQWTKITATVTLPTSLATTTNAPSTAQAQISIRGNGEILVDAFSVRDAASDPNEPYIADGAYTLTVGPRDVLQSTDPLYNAEDIWGLRWATEQVDSITSWVDVVSFAASYFSTRTKLSKRPEVTLVGMWDRNFEPGDGFRINGVAASLADGTMPIVAIKERIDSEGLSSRLQLERVRPSVEGIVRDINRKARYGAGASTGSISSSGGSGGSVGNVEGLYSSGSGVTSVALSAPASLFSVSGSPITTSGTLSLALLAQGANLVWAGPLSGANAAPTFRPLVAADLPASGVTTGSYTNANITVDSKGRITAASNGSGGTSYVPFGATGTGISPTTLSANHNYLEIQASIQLNIPSAASMPRKPYYISASGGSATVTFAVTNTGNSNFTLANGQSMVLMPGAGDYWQVYGLGNNVGAGSASGNAGGDLSGSFPNPTVAKVQGRAVSATAPAVGQVLKWDGSQWAPAADIGSGSLTFRDVIGVTSDIVQTDDVIRLNASVQSTTLRLRGNIAGNKCFDIRRTDTNASNTCYLTLLTSDGAEFPDAGSGGNYAIPPRGGVRLSAYKASANAVVVYEIIAIFGGAAGGSTSAATSQATASPTVQSLD